MRPLLIGTAILVALTACSATEQAEPEPSTTPVNASACDAFAEATNTWLPSIEKNADVWDAELEQIDRIALSAEGHVQERILRLLDELPNIGDVYVYREAREEVNALVDAVARACAADGISVEVNAYVN